MRFVHETSVVLTIALIVDGMYLIDVFDDMLTWVVAPLILIAYGSGLVLVYRNRDSRCFLPIRTHITYAVAAGLLTFVGGAVVHDVLDLHRTAIGVFWVLPILAYVAPCLIWRYERRGQASVPAVTAVLMAIVFVLPYDAWRWISRSSYHRPDPFTFWFAGEGIFLIVALACLFFGGYYLIRLLREL